MVSSESEAASGSALSEQLLDEPMTMLETQLVDTPVGTANRTTINKLIGGEGKKLRRVLPFFAGSPGESIQLLLTSCHSDTTSVFYRSTEDSIGQVQKHLNKEYGDAARITRERISLAELLNLDNRNGSPEVYSYSYRNRGNIHDHRLTTRTTDEDLLDTENSIAARPLVDSIATEMAVASVPSLTFLTFQRAIEDQRDRSTAIKRVKTGSKGILGDILARIFDDVLGERQKVEYEDLSTELQNVIDSMEEKDMSTTTRLTIDSLWFGSKREASGLRDAVTLENEWSHLSLTPTDPEESLNRFETMEVPQRRSLTRRSKDMLPFQHPDHPSILLGRGESWYSMFIPPERLSPSAKKALDIDSPDTTPTRLQ